VVRDVVVESGPAAGRGGRRWGLRATFALVVVAVAVWVVWALWINQPSATPATPTDRWLDVMTGVGAATAAVGVVVGGAWALLYGRKASVSISAEAHPLPDGGAILTARPLVGTTLELEGK
jgi:membrane associated rhomboid family serine protease